MNTTIFEKPKVQALPYIVIDDLEIRLLPDCPKCGANEYHVTGSGLYLVCACGAKYHNRGRV